MNDGEPSVLVCIPTYNEAGNIEPITARLRAAVPDAHILIADDNSPDGTGAIADGLAEADDHVHVLHRTAKEGLGAAYLAAFQWGLDRDFGIIVDGAVIIVEGTVYAVSRKVQKVQTITGKEMDELSYHNAGTMMHSAFVGQLIILIIFAPILCLTGVSGKMFQPMAFTFSTWVL